MLTTAEVDAGRKSGTRRLPRLQGPLPQQPPTPDTSARWSPAGRWLRARWPAPCTGPRARGPAAGSARDAQQQGPQATAVSLRQACVGRSVPTAGLRQQGRCATLQRQCSNVKLPAQPRRPPQAPAAPHLLHGLQHVQREAQQRGGVVLICLRHSCADHEAVGAAIQLVHLGQGGQCRGRGMTSGRAAWRGHEVPQQSQQQQGSSRAAAFALRELPGAA